jgi:SAM-dependent methyltransferase
MGDFYTNTLVKLLNAGVLKREHRIFVACGAWRDRDVLQALGFKDVTISNLFHAEEKDFKPYQWSYQDAENLKFADNAFDFCIVHDGLHHCGSPHRAMLELYRVGKHGFLAFEPPDSWVTRTAIRLGLAQEYEVAAVAGHAYRGGGWRNTIIPNFVHRWTRREIRYAIQSFAPHLQHDFIYVNGAGFNLAGKMKTNSGAIKLAGRGIEAVMQAGSQVFPSLGNLFAFAVIKPNRPEQLQPWLKTVDDGIALNPAWFRSRGFANSEQAECAVLQAKTNQVPENKPPA